MKDLIQETILTDWFITEIQNLINYLCILLFLIQTNQIKKNK